MNRLKGFFNCRKQYIKDSFEGKKENSPSPTNLHSTTLTRYCGYYLTGMNHQDLCEVLKRKNWELVKFVPKEYNFDPDGLIDTYYITSYLYYHEKYGYIIEHILICPPYYKCDDPVLECSYNPVSKKVALFRFEKAVEEQAQIIKEDIERKKAFLYEGKPL